jgi:hypothetical protein
LDLLRTFFQEVPLNIQFIKPPVIVMTKIGKEIYLTLAVIKIEPFIEFWKTSLAIT